MSEFRVIVCSFGVVNDYRKRVDDASRRGSGDEMNLRNCRIRIAHARARAADPSVINMLRMTDDLATCRNTLGQCVATRARVGIHVRVGVR